MNWFKRIFGRAPTIDRTPKPDDREIERSLKVASLVHRHTAWELNKANLRQLEDAEFVRQTLNHVLTTIESKNHD